MTTAPPLPAQTAPGGRFDPALPFMPVRVALVGPQAPIGELRSAGATDAVARLAVAALQAGLGGWSA